MRIAFFGGTFDPPHLGHTRLAEHTLAAGAADQVLFVPSFAPPHKSRNDISEFRHRLAMLELAANLPGMAVSDIERRAGMSPSYTIDILRLLQREHPDDVLLLLIGGDSLAQLHTWRHAEELAEKWEIVTYPRRGEMPTREELLRHWPPKAVDNLLKTVLHLPFFEISSTQARKKVVNGKNLATIINKKVIDYIRTTKLYK